MINDTGAQQLECRECCAPFTFTFSEREFYQRRNLTIPPKRCPTCRAARRAVRERQQNAARAPRVSNPWRR